ncbi:MAG: Rne/Rng family ribonuclease [Phycisphaeraceae bacterium]|nr:Rne/Rng family ribonuclease [Phycisphaeraceae bacterium]
MSKRQMLINYVPGEECRLAVIQDGKLEELHAERLNAVSHVGNIYVGKVVNVEPAIQAAFIDFGLEHNGFLHISDLHPKYFPGEDDSTTERVGKKTPRRERPPIQAALKRGQEIIVQVLKEGIGTKGPTLTSYLSIPGRFLVMMPDMDKVGVSRKVEDEDQRHKMREILDQLDLPEGFGFILRTAGLDRTKTDVKRDLAYLNRLWKDMERRRKSGSKPRLLYAESDLLTRSLRDILSTDISEVIIDDPSALRRAARFMKIISPRRTTKLLHFDQGDPIFHAFGVEEQIHRIFMREVPLPGGGSLVIDETEAMIAIDVNSGKMRNHGDSETTAYKTNCEAVDEICRQLKLRDLGGLVLMDLIDMRSRTHRKQIETQLRNNLKADRARTRALPISQFGIVELTRQRMRGSVRSAHFAACPDCHGRGMVQRPDSVANDAMRELASLLQHERVHRVELVVSARVASELLSNKRRRLGQLERSTSKHVDVRVSETIGVDRLTFYAYDDRGADIDVEKLPRSKAPTNLKEWVDASSTGDDWAVDPLLEAEELAEEIEDEAIDEIEEQDEIDFEVGEPAAEGGKKKRRRRGGRKRRGKSAEDREAADKPAEAPADAAKEDEQGDEDSDEAPKKKRRRRGRRGGRKRSGRDKTETVAETTTVEAPGDESDWVEPEKAPSGDRRGDSWDVEPQAIAPAAEPKSEPAQARPAKQSARKSKAKRGADKKSADTGPKPEAPSRADSWDIEPQAVVSAQASPEPAPAKSNGVPAPQTKHEPSADSRGDSWDVEPEVVTKKPAPAKKKTASKASTAKKKKTGAKKKVSTSATRKKASSTRKKTAKKAATRKTAG